MRELHRDPVVEIHPDTAAKEGIREGDWVMIESPPGQGAAAGKALCRDRSESGFGGTCLVVPGKEGSRSWLG